MRVIPAEMSTSLIETPDDWLPRDRVATEAPCTEGGTEVFVGGAGVLIGGGVLSGPLR